MEYLYIKQVDTKAVRCTYEHQTRYNILLFPIVSWIIFYNGSSVCSANWGFVNKFAIQLA